MRQGHNFAILSCPHAIVCCLNVLVWVCARETPNAQIVFHLSDWVKAEEVKLMRWNLLLLLYVSQRIDAAVQPSPLSPCVHSHGLNRM